MQPMTAYYREVKPGVQVAGKPLGPAGGRGVRREGPADGGDMERLNNESESEEEEEEAGAGPSGRLGGRASSGAVGKLQAGGMGGAAAAAGPVPRTPVRAPANPRAPETGPESGFGSGGAHDRRTAKGKGGHGPGQVGGGGVQSEGLTLIQRLLAQKQARDRERQLMEGQQQQVQERPPERAVQRGGGNGSVAAGGAPASPQAPGTAQPGQRAVSRSLQYSKQPAQQQPAQQQQLGGAAKQQQPTASKRCSQVIELLSSDSEGEEGEGDGVREGPIRGAGRNRQASRPGQAVPLAAGGARTGRVVKAGNAGSSKPTQAPVPAAHLVASNAGRGVQQRAGGLGLSHPPFTPLQRDSSSSGSSGSSSGGVGGHGRADLAPGAPVPRSPAKRPQSPQLQAAAGAVGGVGVREAGGGVGQAGQAPHMQHGSPAKKQAVKKQPIEVIELDMDDD